MVGDALIDISCCTFSDQCLMF